MFFDNPRWLNRLGSTDVDKTSESCGSLCSCWQGQLCQTRAIQLARKSVRGHRCEQHWCIRFPGRQGCHRPFDFVGTRVRSNYYRVVSRMLPVPGFSFALTAPDVYLGSSSDYRSFYRKCPQEPEFARCITQCCTCNLQELSETPVRRSFLEQPRAGPLTGRCVRMFV